jgi:hypothetical protein
MSASDSLAAPTAPILLCIELERNEETRMLQLRWSEVRHEWNLSVSEILMATSGPKKLSALSNE